MKPILWEMDKVDGIVYACPDCHRYVTRESGVHICSGCGEKVDHDRADEYLGRIVYDGRASWNDV